MNDDGSSELPFASSPAQMWKSTTPRGKILPIEDDDEIAADVVSDLADRSYDVTHVADGAQGAEQARREKHDLLIVDILLPGFDGLSVIHALRDEGVRVPVLVLSALSAVNDRVRGLKVGGRPDRVVTRDMLLEDVWHYRFIPQTNLVDVHIGKLRRKIDAPNEAPYLLNLRSMGFLLREPVWVRPRNDIPPVTGFHRGVRDFQPAALHLICWQTRAFETRRIEDFLATQARVVSQASQTEVLWTVSSRLANGPYEVTYASLVRTGRTSGCWQSATSSRGAPC